MTVASAAVFAFTASESVAFAQKTGSSAQKLIDNAKKAFDDAQYDESIQLVSAALLKLDITDPQKVECYKQLAYNYIVLKKDEAAKSAAYKLYAVDESFALPKSESPRFREPFTKWKAQWLEDGKPGQVLPTEKPPAAVTLKHLPPSDTPHDQSVAISGSIDDPDKRVARVALFYRTGTSAKFSEIPCTYGDGRFNANIPGTAMKPPLVEYYVQAVDKEGLPIASRGDVEAPLRLVVEAEKEGSIFGTWWFWTGATAVVAGGILAGILLSKKSSNPSAPQPNPGGNGTVTIILGE